MRRHARRRRARGQRGGAQRALGDLLDTLVELVEGLIK